MNKEFTKGFTLMELLVTISIIAILSSVLFATYNDAREQARDKLRMTDLKELQLAIELYKAQHGRYPAAGCGASFYSGPGTIPTTNPGNFTECDQYITGHVAGVSFTPDFIDVLPKDPKTEEDGVGYYYRTNASGSAYKLMSFQAVETLTIDSYDDEFSRCPKQQAGTSCNSINPPNKIYAVYSVGAEGW